MEKKLILIRENIYSCMAEPVEFNGLHFHHNTRLKSVPRILEYGIVSFNEMLKIEGREATNQELYLRSDENWVNGTNFVSISSDAITEEDIGEWDFLYYSDSDKVADLLLSNDLNACRNSNTYENEFVVFGKIDVSKIKSVDLRILKYLKQCALNDGKKTSNYEYHTYQELFNMYNSLIDIAKVLSEENLDITLRELSEGVLTLNPQKVKKLPKIK